MVVWYHFGPITFFSKNGAEAVTFFFFVSGFVMFLAYSRYLNINSPPFSRLNFYVKRIARIYPLYLFALLILILFHYLIMPIDTNTVKYRLPFEILGIQRWMYAHSFNAPAWTVSCELLFYAIFPFALLYMKKNETHFRVFAWSYYAITYVITIILGFLIKMNLTPVLKIIVSGLYLNPIFLISTFFLGILSGKTFYGNKIKFFRNSWRSLFCFLICVILIFLIKYFIPSEEYLRCGLLSPIYFVMVLSATSFKFTRKPIVSNPFFIYLGEISYGIYILQIPFSRYFFHYIINYKNNWPTFFFFLVILIAFASITYFVVDKPLKKVILSKFIVKKLDGNRET